MKFCSKPNSLTFGDRISFKIIGISRISILFSLLLFSFLYYCQSMPKLYFRHGAVSSVSFVICLNVLTHIGRLKL